MPIFDTHAHMDDRAFDYDRGELLSGLPEAGIGLLMNSGQSPSVVAVADGYGAVLLRDGAGAYIVIGLLAFALGVAATVLCIRLKDRAARRMPEEDAGDGGGHEHGK